MSEWWASVGRAWKPIATILGAIVLIGVAWGFGQPLVSFIATDAEVNIRVEKHEAFIDPKVLELAGALEIVTEQLVESRYTAARNSLARDEALLFDVVERRKGDPLNPDAKARERTLIRAVADGQDEARRMKCRLLKLRGELC